MPPNVHPAAWELITQNHGRRRYDSDSSWEEREHDVFAEDRKRLQQEQQEQRRQFPFFFKKDNVDTVSPELMEALSCVRILDDPTEHQEWLDQHKGRLGDASPKLLGGLR